MYVKTIIENRQMKINSPYNPRFNDEIKKLGGYWQNYHWVVDARQKKRACAVLMDIYGEDGTNPNIDRVNIRLTGMEWQNVESQLSSNQWVIGGRIIVSRRSRNSAAKLGPGVVAVDAEFAEAAGSIKYPDVGCQSDEPVFEVYDVPLAMFNRIKDVKGVELLPEEDDEDPQKEKKAQLENEKVMLLARIAEIDEELAQIEKKG